MRAAETVSRAGPRTALARGKARVSKSRTRASRRARRRWCARRAWLCQLHASARLSETRWPRGAEAPAPRLRPPRFFLPASSAASSSFTRASKDSTLGRGRRHGAWPSARCRSTDSSSRDRRQLSGGGAAVLRAALGTAARLARAWKAPGRGLAWRRASSAKRWASSALAWAAAAPVPARSLPSGARGEHAGALVHHGTPRSPCRRAIQWHYPEWRSAGLRRPVRGRKAPLQGRGTPPHQSGQRLYGAPGLFREEELVHKGDSPALLKRSRRTRTRRGCAGGLASSNEEGRLARGHRRRRAVRR